MNLKELEARITLLEDIEEINKLQRIYGYYLDNGMQDKIVGLFSDDTESVEVADRGVFLGKEGVKKFFLGYLGKGGKPRPPGEMAYHTQLQGVVNVDPGGKTAKGRWYCLMIQSHLKVEPGVPRAAWGFGVYENEYVKENGKWKFKKLYFNLTFRTPYEDGWVKTPMVAGGLAKGADGPPTAYSPYPNQKLVPFHWKHPITGE
jgi:hypothetical protein